MKEIAAWGEKISANISRVFFGKEEAVEKILITLLSGGHILLEDVPGVGKTILSRAMATSLGGEFKRIQCTSDLLPSDIIGVSVFHPEESRFFFRKGPIHANLVLVDEINRATPRTQSALLEAMAEKQISVEGTQRALPEPFFLMATENPVEFEGTFPLPEAQKDRFLMSIDIGYPSRTAEKTMLDSQNRIKHPVEDLKAVSNLDEVKAFQKKIHEVEVDDRIRDYLLDLVEQTRTRNEFRLGVSPRGSLALFTAAQARAALRGRDYVVPEDVKSLAGPIFSQRVLLTPEMTLKGIDLKEFLAHLIDSTDVPVSREMA